MIRTFFHGTCDEKHKEVVDRKNNLEKLYTAANERCDELFSKNETLLNRIRHLEESLALLEANQPCIKQAAAAPIVEPVRVEEAKSVTVELVAPKVTPNAFSNPPRQNNDYKKKR